ncbi:MAG: DUF1553 domain-containing protein [Planctomycetes bacterium]|nr:DUF1553 domain-containing protein [Planctomycetota bacterium]
MVEALSRQGVIQIGTEDEEAGVRWLDASEGVVGQRSTSATWLLDFGRGVALHRRQSEPRVSRSSLKATVARQRDRAVISFLLGNVGPDADSLQTPDLRVLAESSAVEGNEVHLRVTLGGSGASEAVRLDIVLDPETQLPRTCRIDNTDSVTREVTFSYPPTSAAELLAQAFPEDLPVIDRGSELVAGQTVAAVGENTAIADGAAPLSVTATGTAGNSNSLVATTARGAASLGWSPLAPINLSRDEIVKRVDASLAGLWKEHNVTPAAAATEEELLRRVYLDLIGRTPTVNEIRTYAQDPSPERYAALVDRLLASRDHATHLATVWRTILLPEGVDLSRFGGTVAFDQWLTGRFSQNVSYDKLVRELLLAEGRLTKSGPLLFYTAAKLDADQLAARTARVFLGMRLECAQCHDDPFEPWTQQDFWSFAAFFARISRPQAELEAVSTVMQVRDIDRGEVRMPNSETVVPPRFLDGSAVDDSAAVARRQQLAAWLTGPENPYFARAAANRVWAHLFGHGIVDPVDTFGKEHPPRSPEVMDLLAGHFIESGFDLRELFRVVALSRAYRLSSGSDAPDSQRADWFAQVHVKTLTAEQIYDCIVVATLLGSPAGQADGLTLQRAGNSTRETFLQQFRTPSGRRTEYERGIPEALTLMNGTLISDATGLANSGLLKSLEAPFFTDDQRIEVIYLATLSRQPTPAEWKLLREYVASRSPDAPVLEPLADILWAVLNSAEFAMNH